jgi:hypothetical protein
MPEELATTSLVWTNPSAANDQPTLVRLTPERLTLAVVSGADLDNVISGLNAGGEVAGQVIPLPSVLGADGDEDGAGLTVRYRTGPSKTASATIPFADKEKREEFLVALAGALGPGWRRRNKPVSRLMTGFWILLATAVAALATWGLYVEADMIAEGKPPVNWGKGKLKVVAAVAHWVEPRIGPTGGAVGRRGARRPGRRGLPLRHGVPAEAGRRRTRRTSLTSPMPAEHKSDR